VESAIRILILLKRALEPVKVVEFSEVALYVETLVKVGVVTPNKSDLSEVTKKAEEPNDVGVLDQFLFYVR
jgi:hypothetical protein